MEEYLVYVPYFFMSIDICSPDFSIPVHKRDASIPRLVIYVQVFLQEQPSEDNSYLYPIFFFPPSISSSFLQYFLPSLTSHLYKSGFSHLKTFICKVLKRSKTLRVMIRICRKFHFDFALSRTVS